ncbi:hypothetical protein CCR75_009278 [Bremia lactucae]|uniref:Guanine nucleotide-binding protein subunit beta-like protein n=1 Tax=Bremia lactucae TaxID=4779 RepID=A0A976IIK4_BRELC|nr:hypothetical protein CCR75_009278 [Bremia lactucae]
MKEVTSITSSPDAQMYMHIQSNWSDSDQSCWLDVYKRDVRIVASSVHEDAQNKRLVAEAQCTPSSHYDLPLSAASAARPESHLPQIVGRESFWVDVEVNCQTNTSSKKLRTVFQAPNETVNMPMSTDIGPVGIPAIQLYTLDLSKNERYVIVGGADGFCMLWDYQNRTQMLPLKGHVADVTCTRFFPSSQVVLTGSLDFTLRIWSISGHCAAVLKGHQGGVQDVVVIGRGRNVLSCGTDGLIQLWNCGTQNVVARWANDDQSPVHCLSIMEDNTQLLVEDKTQINTSENEVETDGKVFFAGLDNGETLGVDVRARGAVGLDRKMNDWVFTSILNLEGLAGSIVSCATTSAPVSQPMLFTGSEDGLLTIWDLRHPGAPLQTLSRSSATIHSIKYSTQSGHDSTSVGSIWTAHGDGACCKWSNLSIKPYVSTDLTGPHYDAVRGVATGDQSGRVYSACRDGNLREYMPRVIS